MDAALQSQAVAADSASAAHHKATLLMRRCWPHWPSGIPQRRVAAMLASPSEQIADECRCDGHDAFHPGGPTLSPRRSTGTGPFKVPLMQPSPAASIEQQPGQQVCSGRISRLPLDPRGLNKNVHVLYTEPFTGVHNPAELTAISMVTGFAVRAGRAEFPVPHPRFTAGRTLRWNGLSGPLGNVRPAHGRRESGTPRKQICAESLQTQWVGHNSIVSDACSPGLLRRSWQDHTTSTTKADWFSHEASGSIHQPSWSERQRFRPSAGRSLVDPDMPNKLGVSAADICLYKSATLESIGFDHQQLERQYGQKFPYSPRFSRLVTPPQALEEFQQAYSAARNCRIAASCPVECVSTRCPCILQVISPERTKPGS